MTAQVGSGVALANPKLAESACPQNACSVDLPKSTTVAARGWTWDGLSVAHDVEEPPLARRISHSYKGVERNSVAGGIQHTRFALKHDHETATFSQSV